MKKRFDYNARDKEGKIVRGKVEAGTVSDAVKLLRERGLVVIAISAERPSIFAFLGKFTRRVGLDDVAVFTRQFAIMINAGLPITDALVIMRSQANAAMQPVIANVLADVEAGTSLALALEKHKGVFSTVYIALVKAGEEGGVLDKILGQLADDLDSERDFLGKVRGALIYPAIVVVGMLIVSGIMTFFVVPRLVPFFTELGAELPGPTKLLVVISQFGVKFWWLVLASVAGLIWAWSHFSKTPQGKTLIDQWKMNVPIFGPMHRKIVLTELTRTLGLLAQAGVSILEALHIVSGVVGNSIVSKAVQAASVQVEKGFSIAYSFSQTPDIFPPILFQMLAVGEETGKLDETLLKISKVFEQESEQEVKNLTNVIGPVVMVFLAVGVGFLAIAIFLPIYKLPQQI